MPFHSGLRLFSLVFFNNCGSPLGGEPPDYTCNLKRLMQLCKCVHFCDKAGCFPREALCFPRDGIVCQANIELHGGQH